MKPLTATFILSMAAMVLMAALIAFALHSKGNVRASGRLGAGTFTIETAEKGH